MSTATRTSGKAVAALLAGLASAAFGLLALASGSDLFLAGVALAAALAFVLGVRSRAEVRRSAGGLRGKAIASWGMAIPSCGLALGFLLLPAT